MKNVMIWFDDLPQPYRDQAKINVLKAHKEGEKFKSLPDAINSFMWENTTEGQSYWAAAHGGFYKVAKKDIIWDLSDDEEFIFTNETPSNLGNIVCRAPDLVNSKAHWLENVKIILKSHELIKENEALKKEIELLKQHINQLQTQLT